MENKIVYIQCAIYEDIRNALSCNLWFNIETNNFKQNRNVLTVERRVDIIEIFLII